MARSRRKNTRRRTKSEIMIGTEKRTGIETEVKNERGIEIEVKKENLNGIGRMRGLEIGVGVGIVIEEEERTEKKDGKTENWMKMNNMKKENEKEG